MQPKILARIAIWLMILLPAGVFSQTKHSIKGYAKDASSGEDLIGARIMVLELEQGVMTNEYGFYSLTLPEGNYTIVARYLSFLDDTIKVTLDKDISHNFSLAEESITVAGVEITTEAKDQNVKSTEMSVATINVQQIKKLPALMGEVDVVRSIQLLPGVSGVGEGITGYYVRGGQANQNLILLDEATVFNASHVLGFFSVFNSDALKDEYKLYKGGIPAQYGSRLASVLDLRMKEGNSQKFKATGGIGIISSRLSLEAPIVKDKSSFMISARRTYADVFTAFSKNEQVRASKAYFYDLNAKWNYQFSEKDRLFLSGYFGKDVFKFQDLFLNDWGNGTGTLRWNHLFSPKVFSNTTFIFSDFNYGFQAQSFTGDKFKYKSGIRDFSLKEDLNWFINPKNEVRFGWQGIYHAFKPGVFEPVGETFLQPLTLTTDYALENAFYANWEQEINPRLSFLYGLRYSMFDQIGPTTEYEYAADRETIVDSTIFDAGQIVQHYGGFEPRFSFRYVVDEHSSLKGSYNRMRQYLHLASNSTASFPWDIWVPSSRHIPPQIADQGAIGYFRNFFENEVEGSIELYYKYMQNQIDFKTGAELLLNPRIETELLYGTGWSYGAEFLIRKKYGKLTGWIGYTLSKTMRQIDGINDDIPYPATNDRRHDISVVSSYQATPRVNVAATWVYGTGNAVTFPIGKYEVDGQTVAYYGPRNSARMPAYHRMDLAVTIDGKQKEVAEGKRRLESSWNISVYNAYGRRNAFSLDFRPSEEPNEPPKAYKIFLFRWVPSVTWNFNF